MMARHAGHPSRISGPTVSTALDEWRCVRKSVQEAMRRTILAIGGVIGLLLAGCGSSQPRALPITTLAPATSTSTSTTASPAVVDPVPPVITVAYVNSVLAQLDAVYSDALRTTLTTKTVSPSVETMLRAIYADPLYATELRVFHDQLQHIPQDLRTPMGDRITTVAQLISATRSCIFISTHTDFSELVVHPAAPFGSEYYSLVSKIPGDDPNHLNSTPWMFGYNSTSLKPETVPDACRKK